MCNATRKKKSKNIKCFNWMRFIFYRTKIENNAKTDKSVSVLDVCKHLFLAQPRQAVEVLLEQWAVVVWHIRDTSDASVYSLYTDSYTDRLMPWYIDTIQTAHVGGIQRPYAASNWRVAQWAITGYIAFLARTHYKGFGFASLHLRMEIIDLNCVLKYYWSII